MPGPVSESSKGPGSSRQEILTCAYCGHAYPPGTPASQHALLSAHIAECQKHPMRAVVQERDRLKKAAEYAYTSLCQSDEPPPIVVMDVRVKLAEALRVK